MVLVTGGTGLLGTHLILALHKKQVPVRALYRSGIPPVIADKAEWIKGDLLDVSSLETALEGITQVFHVAGFVSFNPKHREILYRVNVDGTCNLVNACLVTGIGKMVHVSSVAAMGRSKKQEPVNESMFWEPKTSNSEYSRTKYLGEMEVWRGIGEGLNAVIVNPTVIFGEHGNWKKGSMNIFRNVYNGFPWYSTGGGGFVDADDVAEAMIQLMDSDITSERFLINAENRSYAEIFFMIADAFGVKRAHRKVSPFLAGVVWRIETLKSFITGKDPLVTKETAKTGLSTITINNHKLLQALPGFKYRPLKESINRICNALKGSDSGD
jgi:nucleoside-diphosphate-sugar epimerase